MVLQVSHTWSIKCKGTCIPVEVAGSYDPGFFLGGGGSTFTKKTSQETVLVYICSNHNPETCLQVALLLYSYHRYSEPIFFFICPNPLSFSPFWIMASQLSSCPNQDPGNHACPIPFPTPHRSLVYFCSVSSVLPHVWHHRTSLPTACPFTGWRTEFAVGAGVRLPHALHSKWVLAVLLHFGNVWKERAYIYNFRMQKGRGKDKRVDELDSFRSNKDLFNWRSVHFLSIPKTS